MSLWGIGLALTSHSKYTSFPRHMFSRDLHHNFFYFLFRLFSCKSKWWNLIKTDSKKLQLKKITHLCAGYPDLGRRPDAMRPGAHLREILFSGWFSNQRLIFPIMDSTLVYSQSTLISQVSSRLLPVLLVGRTRQAKYLPSSLMSGL